MRKRCVGLIPKPSVVTRVSSAESGLRYFSCMRIYLEMLTNLHAPLTLVQMTHGLTVLHLP